MIQFLEGKQSLSRHFKSLHFFPISNPLCIRRNLTDRGSRESLILLGIRDHLEALSVVDKIKVFEGVSTIFEKSRQIKNLDDDTIESIYEPISIEQLGTPKEPKFYDSIENDSPILVVEPIYQRMNNDVQDELLENITDDYGVNEKSVEQVIKKISVVSGSISFDEMSKPASSPATQKFIKPKKVIDGNEEIGSLISQAIESLLNDHPSNSDEKINHTGLANEEDNGGLNNGLNHGMEQGMTDPRKLRTLLK